MMVMVADSYLQEITEDEYTALKKLYHNRLKVFSVYSQSIPGVKGWWTEWGLKGFETGLVASECESEEQMNDPEAWTYYCNKDQVRLLAEIAELKALVRAREDG